MVDDYKPIRVAMYLAFSAAIGMLGGAILPLCALPVGIVAMILFLQYDRRFYG